MRLSITPALLGAIRHHAEQQMAQEVCGVLLGIRADSVVVTEVRAGENTLAASNLYLLDAATLLAADDAATATGVQIVGFYHSHPHAPPIPSSTDRASAWMDYVYLIISSGDAKATVLCGWLIDDRRRVVPVLIEVDNQQTP